MLTKSVPLEEVVSEDGSRRIRRLSPATISVLLMAGIMGLPPIPPAGSFELEDGKERKARAEAKRARRNAARPGRYA